MQETYSILYRIKKVELLKLRNTDLSFIQLTFTAGFPHMHQEEWV
jgi:hypothetical protein